MKKILDNCEQCGAPMGEDALRCEYCGTRYTMHFEPNPVNVGFHGGGMFVVSEPMWTTTSDAPYGFENMQTIIEVDKAHTPALMSDKERKKDMRDYLAWLRR